MNVPPRQRRTSVTDAKGLRAIGAPLPPDAAENWVMTAENGQREVVAIGGGWVIPMDDPRQARQVTWLRPEFQDMSETDIAGRENWWASYLVASRRYDVISIERQGRVLDYREEGAAYDRKIAEVLARNRQPD